MATMAEHKGRRTRRSFDEDYKAAAVRLVLDEGKTVAAAARDLGLTESSLRNWVDQARADRTKGKTGLTTAHHASSVAKPSTGSEHSQSNIAAPGRGMAVTGLLMVGISALNVVVFGPAILDGELYGLDGELYEVLNTLFFWAGVVVAYRGFNKITQPSREELARGDESKEDQDAPPGQSILFEVAVSFCIFGGLALGTIYGLVRFVKWAWTD